MKPTVKRKWLRALRSGKYRRATGQLQTDRGYCCLGVLCKANDFMFAPDDSTLGPSLRNSIGMTGDQEAALIGLNDGCYDKNDETNMKTPAPKGYRGADRGASFKVIADFIEKHL